MGRMVKRFLFFFCQPSRLRRSGCTFAKCIFSNASSIFDHFGILDHLGPFQTIVDHFRLSWTILDHLGPYWIILNNIGPWHNFLTILDHFLTFPELFLTILDHFLTILDHLLKYPVRFLTIFDHFLTIFWHFLTSH